jgi:two-component system, OmpR family, sensor histidine kinase KdpD
MSRREPLLTLQPREKPQWERYLLDSLLALVSIFLLTSVIWLFRLYQRIPDSFLVYLLAILSLAAFRGRYAALIASFVAFFSFDVFFVPPLYNLIAAKFEDVLTLIVFLVVAMITSQLASTLRQHAEDARRREYETHILYDLVRATNREENLGLQLSIFARAVVEVFFPYGIRDCMLLLPDEQNVLMPHMSICQPFEGCTLPPAEKALAERIMVQAETMDLYDGPIMHDENVSSANVQKTTAGPAMKRYVRLVPLKTDLKVIGVLRLLIEHDTRGGTTNNILGLEHIHSTPEAVFFSMFLEQAVAVIERGKLRQESFRIKVLQQTDTLRSALLSSVSHDLRTPLSTIKTAATSLMKEEVDWDKEARRSFTSAIEREADRLNRLVENLLDMSRIEAGSLHPEKVWYSLDALVRDVLDRMQPFLDGRMVQTDFPDSLPPMELDYMLIEQVITNLINNAVHYTPPGSPIDVSIQLQDDVVVVGIADRGPGIAPTEQEQIFNKFYRVFGRAHAPGDAQGSGLGLAICRGLVEAHGGRIWVEPRQGGGAVFRFTLPLSHMGELEL